MVVGIPSCATFNNNERVGNVNEYIDIAYVDIFLAIIIFAKMDSTLASKLIEIILEIEFIIFFLMLFHLSYCLFYEKMIKYMSKYFFNIYLYIIKK